MTYLKACDVGKDEEDANENKTRKRSFDRENPKNDSELECQMLLEDGSYKVGQTGYTQKIQVVSWIVKWYAQNIDILLRDQKFIKYFPPYSKVIMVHFLNLFNCYVARSQKVVNMSP